MTWRHAVPVLAAAVSPYGCAPAAVVACGAERIVRNFGYRE